MLNASFIDTWVPKLIPSEYGPNKSLKEGKILLGVYLVKAEKMEFSKNFWLKDTKEDTKMYGQLVDMGEILGLVRNDETLKGRYIIRLNESQSEACGIFTLAHEMGHLYGILNDKEEHDKDPDVYADNYAFNATKEVITDSDLLIKVYYEAFLHVRV